LSVDSIDFLLQINKEVSIETPVNRVTGVELPIQMEFNFDGVLIKRKDIQLEVNDG